MTSDRLMDYDAFTDYLQHLIFNKEVRPDSAISYASRIIAAATATLGAQWITQEQKTQTYAMLRGLRDRLRMEDEKRKPPTYAVSAEDMLALISSLPRNAWGRTMKAIMTMLFGGCLRPGELLGKRGTRPRRCDVTVSDSWIDLRLRIRKTTQRAIAQPQVIRIVREMPGDPVTALKEHLAAIPTNEEELIFDMAWTEQFFNGNLRYLAAKAKLAIAARPEWGVISGRSFRPGGVNFLKDRGASDNDIQALGGWTQPAGMRPYLRSNHTALGTRLAQVASRDAYGSSRGFAQSAYDGDRAESTGAASTANLWNAQAASYTGYSSLRSNHPERSMLHGESPVEEEQHLSATRPSTTSRMGVFGVQRR